MKWSLGDMLHAGEVFVLLLRAYYRLNYYAWPSLPFRKRFVLALVPNAVVRQAMCRVKIWH